MIIKIFIAFEIVVGCWLVFSFIKMERRQKRIVKHFRDIDGAIMVARIQRKPADWLRIQLIHVKENMNDEEIQRTGVDVFIYDLEYNPYDGR